MPTFLEQVQDLYRELGLSGSPPTTVVGQTNIRRQVVDYIANADYAIQTLWSDWGFMWSQWERSTVAGQVNYAAPSSPAVARYDLESFYLDYSTNPQQLEYCPYKKWRELFRNGSPSNGKPRVFTVLPDRSISFDCPADAAYTLSADYFRRPTKMTADGHESPIPEEFSRIILARAKLIYAEQYRDQEIIMSAGAEYGLLLTQLEASELPDRPDRSSEAPLTFRVKPE